MLGGGIDERLGDTFGHEIADEATRRPAHRQQFVDAGMDAIGGRGDHHVGTVGSERLARRRSRFHRALPAPVTMATCPSSSHAINDSTADANTAVMRLDIGRRVVRRHQRHVVERRQQDARG